MSVWQELTLTLPEAEAAEAGELLESLGALSVTTTGADDAPLFVAHAGEAATLWARCVLTALFAEADPFDEIRAAVAARYPEFELGQRVVTDADWAAGLAPHSVSLDFSDGALALRPKAERGAHMAPNTVYLDAGLAFGSGSHPTTRMCLAYLAEAHLTGRKVLDFGCGSGVLAIAAAIRGAQAVVAVDIDPQARLATEQNAHYNAVPEAVLTVLPNDQFDPEQQRFDLVVANILAQPLIALAPILGRALLPGGTLVLTGVLREQADEVAAAYPDVALAIDASEQADGGDWVRLVGSARASA